MLAIQKSNSHKGKCTPNLLPCRVHHNGPVNASKRYWDPKTMSVGVRKEPTKTSYFRGRKLHGRTLPIPNGYLGLVLSKTDRILPKPKLTPHPTEQEEQGAADGDVEEVDDEEEVKVIEVQAEFEELVVWGHECLVDEMGDVVFRGVGEWIGFSGVIHGVGVGEE